MKRFIRTMLLVSLIGLVLLGITASQALCQATKLPAEIKIGWMGGLTGLLAEFALDVKKGTDLALEEINGSGGVLGKPVKLVYADTKTDPQIAVQSAQRLITSDKVVAILGDYFSPNTLAILDTVEKAKMPLFSPGSNATEITQKGKKFIARDVIPSAYSGEVIAKYAVDTLKLKSFVIFSGTDAYTRANGDAFKKYVEDNKLGEIRAYETYDRGSTRDFTNLLLKYKEKQPDAIFTAGGPSDSALVVKQAREVGITCQFLGTLSQAKASFYEIAGKAAIGMCASNNYPGDAVNVNDFAEKSTIDFIAKWKQKYGVQPPYDTASGYDGLKILALAINQAKSLEGEKIMNQILSIKDYKGAIGTITMQPNGDGITPMYIMRYDENGKLMIIKGR
jgi:branched-chain amino acid transport system substrate-binding protein